MPSGENRTYANNSDMARRMDARVVPSDNQAPSQLESDFDAQSVTSRQMSTYEYGLETQSHLSHSHSFPNLQSMAISTQHASNAPEPSSMDVDMTHAFPTEQPTQLDESYASEELQAQLLQRRQSQQTLPASHLDRAPLRDTDFYRSLPPEQQECLLQQMRQQEQLEMVYTELQQHEARRLAVQQQQQQQRADALNREESIRQEHEKRLLHFQMQQQQNEMLFRQMEEQRMREERRLLASQVCANDATRGRYFITCT